MQQQIQLNIIPFTPVAEKLTFSFYGEKQPGYASIKWDKLFETFPEDRDPELKNYYCDFQSPRNGAVVKEIDVFNAVNFIQKYYRYQILQYFKSIEGAIVFPNFVDDVEVWFEEKTTIHDKYKLYHNYALKIQYKGVSKGYELVIAYNGTSRILRQSMAELSHIDPGKFNFINCNGTLYKSDKIPDSPFQDIETQYPVINYELKRDLLKEKEDFKIENRYPEYLRYTSGFFNNYINTPDFNKILNLSENGFFKVDDKDVYHVEKDSNMLKFLQGEHVSPGFGISSLKPYKTINKGTYKIFFIHHKEDTTLINETISNYIKFGWHKPVDGKDKHSKSFHSFINHFIFIDETKNIVFENTDNLLKEVSDKIKVFVKDSNTTYIAVFISPVSKLDKEHSQHKAYYKLKEQLLHKGITSQVIYKENLPKEDFYYFLPNIYVAMLAKLGGIPWRLASTIEDEIIIGIGAFKPKGAPHRFVGSAFCFSNEGVFEGFNCFRENETTMLAGSIREAVEKFIEKKQKLNRVIIHFYKEISDNLELKPILKMLDDLGEGDVPVIVVTINKTDSKELLGFDLKSPGKMPYSGSYVKVGYNKYLLFNNTRYFDNKFDLKPRDYHFPVKLSIRASKKELVEDLELVKNLVDQVYQFSRMYWKSISQQNLPVTTVYPEMVAQIFPHFEHDTLPEFGKENLWFL